MDSSFEAYSVPNRTPLEFSPVGSAGRRFFQSNIDSRRSNASSSPMRVILDRSIESTASEKTNSLCAEPIRLFIHECRDRLRRSLTFLAVIVLCAVPARIAAADEAGDRSAKIRAAIVYYVAKFVSWPAEAFSSAEAPLNICVFGSDPLIPMLAETLHGRKLGSHPIDLHERADKFATVDECHVVLIGATPDADKLLMLAEHKAILSICIVDAISWGRCTVQLFAEKNRARIAVDLEQAAAHRLQIGSELLDVAILKEKP